MRSLSFGPSSSARNTGAVTSESECCSEISARRGLRRTLVLYCGVYAGGCDVVSRIMNSASGCGSRPIALSQVKRRLCRRAGCRRPGRSGSASGRGGRLCPWEANLLGPPPGEQPVPIAVEATLEQLVADDDAALERRHLERAFV